MGGDGGRPQAAGRRRQAAGDRRQATGDGRRATGDGRRATGDGDHVGRLLPKATAGAVPDETANAGWLPSVAGRPTGWRQECLPTPHLRASSLPPRGSALAGGRTHVGAGLPANVPARRLGAQGRLSRMSALPRAQAATRNTGAPGRMGSGPRTPIVQAGERRPCRSASTISVTTVSGSTNSPTAALNGPSAACPVAASTSQVV